MLRPLAELLARIDLDADRFLAELGIDADAALATYVSGQRVDDLLDELAAKRGDPSFGLTLAKIAVVRPLGLFSHMVWLSGTMRDAMIRAARFYAMVSRRTILSLDEHGAFTTLRQQRMVGVPRGTILTEFPFASLALRARAETGGKFALRA